MGSRGGKFVVAFDPLDGSRNIDAGIPTGQSADVVSYAPRFHMRVESAVSQALCRIPCRYRYRPLDVPFSGRFITTCCQFVS